MQSKYSLFTELWDRVCFLEIKLSNCLDNFLNDDFSLVGLTSLTPTEKDDLVTTIQAAISNLNFRFPCPSTSLNKRRFGNTNDNGNQRVERRIVQRAYTSCPLRVLFDVYVFPCEFLRNSTVKQHLLSEYDGEVVRLCVQTSQMKDALLSSFKDKYNMEERGTDTTGTTINLGDVFQHVPQSHYPELWKCVLAVRAINPTTVSCEQSFSCLKHSHHVNMKMENLCSLVGYRLSLAQFDEKTVKWSCQTDN